MSILSGAIGTMKKKGSSLPLWYQVPGTFNSKTYWVTGRSSEPNAGASGLQWGSYGTTRGTTSLTGGLANSTTLAGFGQAAHPAAHYCRNLTLGGYSWFLPAKDELNHIYANIAAAGKLLAPAGTHTDKFAAATYWTSSELTGDRSVSQAMESGSQGHNAKSSTLRVRAVRVS